MILIFPFKARRLVGWHVLVKPVDMWILAKVASSRTTYYCLNYLEQREGIKNWGYHELKESTLNEDWVLLVPKNTLFY